MKEEDTERRECRKTGFANVSAVINMQPSVAFNRIIFQTWSDQAKKNDNIRHSD